MMSPTRARTRERRRQDALRLWAAGRGVVVGSVRIPMVPMGVRPIRRARRRLHGEWVVPPVQVFPRLDPGELAAAMRREMGVP